MTQIIRTKKATGAQLQQAAHHVRLIDTPNMPFGFSNAYYASTPSPMQEQILRKALQSIGVNYLKVTQVCVPAEPQDLFPDTVKTALRNVMKELVRNGAGDEHRIGVAGRILYATIPTEGPKQSETLVRKSLKNKGFSCHGHTWTKDVKIERKRFCAVVEVEAHGVSVSVFKGA